MTTIYTPNDEGSNFSRRLLVKTVLAVATVASIFTSSVAHAAETQLLDVEKDELTIGFIKLTDMAPLAVAYENGYFED